jgi:hypothetical protein
MAVTGRSAPAPDEATRAEIERVRVSGVLGRSGRLLELFDYLAARAADPTPPKEVEIALMVFGKAGAEAVKDDPVARVYVHRLRKRLDDFYLREGAPNGVRLALPKGEYRLTGLLLDGAKPEPLAEEPTGPTALSVLSRRWRLVAGAAVALLLGNVAAWAAVSAGRGKTDAELIRRDPIWAELADGGRPLLIVVGDYYMFAEYEGGGLFLNRLVRDFAINSREDLLRAQREMENDGVLYSDVDLRYLPISTAFALTRVMGALPDGRDVRVSLASEVNPETFRDYDIVYVGLMSGLGALREPAFAASRFAVGETYDELVDTQTGERYLSEAFEAAPAGAMHRDYGFTASFAGPRGNRILIIAGARDAGVMGVAESLTRPSSLAALHQKVGAAQSLEALYEIQGQGHVSLESAVVAAAARDDALIWATQASPPQFPSE